MSEHKLPKTVKPADTYHWHCVKCGQHIESQDKKIVANLRSSHKCEMNEKRGDVIAPTPYSQFRAKGQFNAAVRRGDIPKLKPAVKGIVVLDDPILDESMKTEEPEALKDGAE